MTSFISLILILVPCIVFRQVFCTLGLQIDLTLAHDSAESDEERRSDDRVSVVSLINLFIYFFTIVIYL